MGRIELEAKTCRALNKSFPPDIRVEKEARSLTRAGHKVHLVCIGDINETETVEGVEVHSLFFDRFSITKRVLNSRRILNYFYIEKWCKNCLKCTGKRGSLCSMHMICQQSPAAC